MSRHPRPRTAVFRTAVGVIALAALLTSCAAKPAQDASSPDGSVVIGAHSNGAATQTTIEVPQVDEIRAELPKEVIERGTLIVGTGALPEGYPPNEFIGDDQKTITGSEPDIARLVAAVLGLKIEIKNATWDNMFVGVDTGAVDAAFSNITVTEDRKEKYDFASYRKGYDGFAVLESSSWNFDGDYRNLAGLTISTDSGGNTEKIAIEWQKKLRDEGKDLEIKYFPDQNSIYLALASGKIDAYYSANPSLAYKNKQNENTANPTRSAGVYSAAGSSLQGLLGSISKKGSGTAKPIADAINYLIENGQYAQWLDAYDLSDEAVDQAEINPVGLPKTNE